jgi:hypothetical protein
VLLFEFVGPVGDPCYDRAWRISSFEDEKLDFCAARNRSITNDQWRFEGCEYYGRTPGVTGDGSIDCAATLAGIKNDPNRGMIWIPHTQ